MCVRAWLDLTPGGGSRDQTLMIDAGLSGAGAGAVAGTAARGAVSFLVSVSQIASRRRRGIRSGRGWGDQSGGKRTNDQHRAHSTNAQLEYGGVRLARRTDVLKEGMGDTVGTKGAVAKRTIASVGDIALTGVADRSRAILSRTPLDVFFSPSFIRLFICALLNIAQYSALGDEAVGVMTW